MMAAMKVDLLDGYRSERWLAGMMGGGWDDKLGWLWGGELWVLG